MTAHNGFSHGFTEKASHQRWAGYLGEIKSRKWYKRRGIEHVWYIANYFKAWDFLLNKKTTVDVKCYARCCPMRPDYDCTVKDKDLKKEGIREFFFMSYEYPRKLMYFVGGISREKFIKLAKFYPAGALVHPGFTSLTDNWILPYNKGVTPAAEWLKQFERN